MQTHIKQACTNTQRAHAGLCFFFFLLCTGVIAFLMVLEVITPCNVTCRLVLSSEPQHGSSEVPYTIHHSLLNDSISQKASAIASSRAQEYEARFSNSLTEHTRVAAHWEETHKLLVIAVR